MIDEFVGIWKEAVVAQSRCFPSLYPKELEKITKFISEYNRYPCRDFNLQNTCLETYH
jgi:uncharacterized membrane protein (UPF0182 family)